MVDIDAAIGYIVARGDLVDRARLSHLRTGAAPAEDIMASLEAGQLACGGWPAENDGQVASIDATCFRLSELDDLDGLSRPAAVRALSWLASRQRPDGTWEEDPALARSAPPWARPGDPDARFYLTATAAYWIAVASADRDASADPLPISPLVLERAAEAIKAPLADDGSWPGFLASGWLAAAVLHRTGWFYEAVRILLVLADRAPAMSAADAASMASALVRAGVSAQDSAVVAARARLDATQLPDGSWPSDDAPALGVHTALVALRAVLPRP